MGLSTQFNVFVPSSKSAPSNGFPVLYYLSGLTCNEDTGAWKGGFLGHAQACGIALVFPDTSPRGAKVEGEEDSWDLGTAAGFYLDATAEKWAKHYRMFSFVTQELVGLLKGTDLPLVCAEIIVQLYTTSRSYRTFHVNRLWVILWVD